MTEKTTAPLADFGAGDIASAGGKGAALGELVRQGFPVPPGFIITTGAYLSFLAETRVGAALEGLLRADSAGGPDIGTAEGESRGAAIRALFVGTEVPGQLRQEIGAAYAELGGGAVAVRSSATAEDLPGAAFAGQQDTYLNVLGEDAVVQAVADCWASLWTDRAVAYRQRQGIDPRGLAIAVVVQRMVPADTAGVMFTANPVTGERGEIVVDASPGLGEAVVAGRVTPEHYVLDRTGKALSFAPGGREVVISAAEGGGTQENPGAPGTGPELAADQLAELARLGQRAQQHFGRPQDIEWAVSGGVLYVLQSRPMTALPPQPQTLNPFQRRLGPFFMEMFQERPYPLDVSGWMSRGILAMLHRMAGSVGVVFPTVEQLLPEEDGVVVRLVPPIPHPTIRTLAAPVSLVRRARQFNPASWTQDPRFSAFLENVEQLNGKDPGPLRWRAVVALVEESFATMRGITDLRVSYLPGVFVPLLKMRLMLLLLGKGKLAAALIAGAETRTSQANRALEQLAAVAADDPGLARAFAESDPGRLLELVEKEPEHVAFREAFKAFLLEYGHRETISVVLSSAPTWSDAPEVVLGLVKAMFGERLQAVDQTGMALCRVEEAPSAPVRAAAPERAGRRRVRTERNGVPRGQPLLRHKGHSADAPSVSGARPPPGACRRGRRRARRLPPALRGAGVHHGHGRRRGAASFRPGAFPSGGAGAGGEAARAGGDPVTGPGFALWPEPPCERCPCHRNASQPRPGERARAGDPWTCRVRPAAQWRDPGLPVYKPVLDTPVPAGRRGGGGHRRARLACGDRGEGVRNSGCHGHRFRYQHPGRRAARTCGRNRRSGPVRAHAGRGLRCRSSRTTESCRAAAELP